MPLPAIGAAKTRGIGAFTPSALPLELSFDRLFSAEGIMMLTLAGLFDLLGFLDFIPIVGNILGFLLDIPAIILIGGWLLFFKSKRVQPPARTTTRFARVGRIGKWGARIFVPMAELAPLAGILPLWVALVFIELVTD